MNLKKRTCPIIARGARLWSQKEWPIHSTPDCFVLHLATFNIESFGDDKFRQDLLEPRIQALRPKLTELEADILCLQEVNAQKVRGEKLRQFLALDALIEGTAYQDFYRAFSVREDTGGPDSRHNLMVLSKFPILETKVHLHPHMNAPLWQPQHAEPPFSEPQNILFDRPILQVKLDIGLAAPLHVFVVHLRAPIAAPIPGGKVAPFSWKSVSCWAEGYFLASVKRVAQALDLRLMVERILDTEKEALIAVAGDFNVTGDGAALRLLLGDPDDTGNPDLEGNRLHQLDAALPLDLRRTVIHMGKGQALDHILATPALARTMQDIEVFNDGLADEVLDAGTSADAGSFHAAMRAVFRLGPE